MSEIIYFDNAATTKPAQGLLEAFKNYCDENWYNPSALYKKSSDITCDMDNVRALIKDNLGVIGGQVIFTSGGTESNNIAINSALRGKKGCHIVTSGFEHDAVYNTIKSYEDSFEITHINPNKDGVIDVNDVLDAVKENTLLVSVMHVNNETGALNDINDIANAVKSKNSDIVFHSDGVQGFMKIPFSLNQSIDYYSLSAHKIGGIKGCGALYAKNGLNVSPLMYGGGQEKNIRSGTENTFGIISFGYAIQNFNKDIDLMYALRSKLIDCLTEIDGAKINSPMCEGLFSPYILNASIVGVRSETLVHALEDVGYYIGVGSACSSKKKKNRVHNALGLNFEQSESAIRVSFSHDNTSMQVEKLAYEMKQQADMLKMFKRR